MTTIQKRHRLVSREAWSDGAQQVSLEQFATQMRELRPFIAAAGRASA